MQKADYRENLINQVTNELESNKFASRSKNGFEGVFTRVRKLSFSRLIIFIMSTSRAIQRELDDFLKKINNENFSIREVTKSAFTQARAKLNPWAFVRLNEVTVEGFYETAEYYVWRGMRLLAVDGTRLVLPNHPSVVKEYGLYGMGPNGGSQKSMALASMLYDVLNQVTIDAQIAPYKESEISLLHKHLPKLKKNDLLLADRGYPSLYLFFLLFGMDVQFCMRMKDSWWREVKKFAKSNAKEGFVEFELPARDRNKLKEFPELWDKKITCRLVRVELENGEFEILCTSLLDTSQYPHSDFIDMYHLRWNEEEAYKLLKSRIELENFSGKTALAVKQDFHAKIFLMTLTSALAHPIAEKVSAEYKAAEHLKHEQQINQTSAIAMTREILIGVFLKNMVKTALSAFDSIVSSTREIVRPGRKLPRKKIPKRPYPMNYKRL